MNYSIKGISLSRFGDLPMPVKAGMALMGGAGIMVVADMLTGGDTTVLMVLSIGLLAIALALVAYKMLLGTLRKRKANPLAQGLSGNASAAPQGVSEPARRARLDDLRRNFEQGVEKFRAAGKNLYSVPWYVLVGEPGSGKTEAIRHCNVGFPPGLQDQLQGAGGTLNMNWWFTNQAIILDTAGRLMFEEIVPGSTNEWNEFLKLLKQSRPNSPLNGVLLVIPVDTLIKDGSEQIEKKAGKIAQQFDQIQRSLGVRFPVFVIITKCDLLNGFREFFDDLNDPTLQHQMMGWSNPGSLDDKFDPSAVVNHLETVKQRLMERRRQLLLDPVNTEDAQARRVDQVDALYALPDSLMKIAPRLRRYLEMIFVAGEWSPKPLFLRGIYFTSSMTEGSALDAELADVLGVPVDSLPEGRVWRRDRAYFLRDLFIEKVFRERGLVTRASNADKQQRTRRAVVLTCGFCSVVVLGLLTFLGWKQLNTSIGKHRDFWTSAAEADPRNVQIINRTSGAYVNTPFALGQYSGDLAHNLAASLPLMQTPIHIPVIFRPIAFMSGNVDTARQNAFRAFFEGTVLSPVYNATRAKVKDLTPETWNDNATRSLMQLMKAQYGAAENHKTAAGDPHPNVALDPMFQLVLSPADFTHYKVDADDLQKTADWVYTSEAGGTAAWPPAALGADSAYAMDAVDSGLTTALDYWKRQATDKGPHMGAILEARSALNDFRAAEDKLIALKARPIDTMEPYNGFVDSWQAALAQLTNARTRAQAAWAEAAKRQAETVTLNQLYSDEIERIGSEAQKVYTNMLKYTPDADPGPKGSAAARALFADRQKIQAAADALKDWQNGADAKKTLADINSLDASYIALVKGTDNAQHHRFEVEAQLYDLADTFVVRKDAKLPALTTPLGTAIDDADSKVTSEEGTIDRLLIQASNNQDRLFQAGATAKFAIETGTRCRKYLLARDAMAPMPADAAQWTTYIAAVAAKQPAQRLLRPQLPLIDAEKTFPAKFSPDAVGTVTEVLKTVDALTGGTTAAALNGDELRTQSQKVKTSFATYRAAYIQYWTQGVQDEVAHFSPKNDWAAFSGGVLDLREKTVNAMLYDYGTKISEALTKIGAQKEANDAQLAMQLAQNKNFEQECSDVVDSWRNLGDNARQARGAVLSMDPGKFLENFTVGTATTTDGYVSRYWRNFALEGVNVLAKEGQKDILAGLQELQKYQRFPLANPGDTGTDLSLKELLAARSALQQIRGAAVTAPTSAPGAGTVATIGQGGATRDKDMDADLSRLRGTDLLQDKLSYLANMEKFLNAFPTDEKPLRVTLTVLKDKLKDSDSVSQKYAYMDIAQGKDDLREAFLGGTVTDQAEIHYAGAPLTFAFRDVPKGPVRKTETFAGPWAVFRLLKSPNVESIQRDGTKWTIEYGVKDANNKVWSLWLQLEFKAEVPDLKNWPVPPSGRTGQP